MSDIVLLDTSIYLNVLDVPGRNQDRNKVLEEFELRINHEDHFLLPLVAILETGNHIGNLLDGNRRREYSIKLVEDIVMALDGKAPYRATYFPSREEFSKWVMDFSENHHSISLGDHLIIKEWERTCKANRMSRVLIWSLDNHLRGYDQKPTKKRP